MSRLAACVEQRCVVRIRPSVIAPIRPSSARLRRRDCCINKKRSAKVGIYRHDGESLVRIDRHQPIGEQIDEVV